MLVLHGFWSPDDGLCLWAEDSDRTVKSPSQALRSARPHPFAAPAGVLAGTCAGKPGAATLLLPSLRTAPLDSPELAVFYLLAEAFDEDPFTILAWRGREREELLGNLRAARSGGPPAADHAEQIGTPLADCLDSYFSMQAELPATRPITSPGASLLDQVSPLDVALRGHTIVELLRPAYLALANHAGIRHLPEAPRTTKA